MLSKLIANRKLRILIVDDVDDNRLVLKAYLSKLNAEIDEADNAEHTMTKVFTEKFDIVILDYKLPDFNGDEIAKRIRAHKITDTSGHSIVLVMHSSHDDEYIRKLCMGAGINEFIHKPISRVLFLKMLQCVIDSHI